MSPHCILISYFIVQVSKIISLGRFDFRNYINIQCEPKIPTI